MIQEKHTINISSLPFTFFPLARNPSDIVSLSLTRNGGPKTLSLLPPPLDDSVATTTTTISRLEMTLTTNPGSISGENTGSLIVPSTSNNNSLSGNDYVEVTSTGEAKPLVKNSSSNSLNKSLVLLTKLSADDPIQRQYNPYDNIPEIRSNRAAAKAGAKKGGCAGDEKWRESSASACCHSEFVDFIDNLEERRGSLKSVTR